MQVAEFTVNEQRADGFNVPQRRGYEQLLRKLLKLRDGAEQQANSRAGSPGGSHGGRRGGSGSRASGGGVRLPPPAIIVLHHYGWWISNVNDEFEPGNYHENNEAQLHTFSNVSKPRTAASRA